MHTTRKNLQFDLKTSFLGFIAEQFPLVYTTHVKAIENVFSDLGPHSDLRAFSGALLSKLVPKIVGDQNQSIESTPTKSIAERLEREEARLILAVDGFFQREALKKSINPEQKKALLKGIILTRTVDLALKKLFMSSEIKYNGAGFQGKGFRSLGQEAIYAASLFLKKQRDVVGPLIRDLGIALALTDNDVISAINAQVGKDGPPTRGRDLHIGDFSKGVWPPAAPLAISSCSLLGVAQSFKLRNEDRVAVSFIGEGGSSLGEWHEAINCAAVQNLPMIFCIQNNQTALSTNVHSQSSVRVFADKAIGYGIPGITIDGTDPEEIAAAFGWAAQRARTGKGATLIELVAMRMCGHAHHDDMLYLGHEPNSKLDYDIPNPQGYIDQERFAYWAPKDPIKTYGKKLVEENVCLEDDIRLWVLEAKEKCDLAIAELKERTWPEVTPSAHYFSWPRPKQENVDRKADTVFSPQGSTYMEAIALAIREQMQRDERVFMLGEDIAPPYGNAFMMFRSMPKELWPRFINTPIAENAIIGSLVGMSAMGLRPIGEMQFNDFSASAFNQIVNNAAKLAFRTGIKAPFVLRMPYGGLRRAGPYHSQDTTPWFHRSFGLKIVVPSTPSDARALFHAAMRDVDPVLFYEHIALYRDPSIKQVLPNDVPNLELGKAAILESGSHLSIISYGAFVHRAIRVAHKLKSEKQITCDVIDLRSLVPLDFDTIYHSIHKTNRVLLLTEDSRTGSFMESLAAKIAQGLFEKLDAPPRILGSHDTPVPYSPPLEDAFLVSDDEIFQAAIELVNY